MPDTDAERVSAFRELSALTAPQVARLFDVSSRTVDAWAAGAVELTGAERERLERLTEAITGFGDTPGERRRYLLASPAGMSPFHRLAAEATDSPVIQPAPFSVRDRLRA